MKPVLDYADREIMVGNFVAYSTSTGGMGIYKVAKLNQKDPDWPSLSATEYFQKNIGEPFYRGSDKTVCLKFPHAAIVLPDGFFNTSEELYSNLV